MDDARFYFVSASGLAIAASLSASLMKAAHVEDGQSAMIIGFSGVLFTNALVAYRAASKAEEVKVALVASTAEIAVKAEQVRVSLAQSEMARANAAHQADAHADQIRHDLKINASQIEAVRATTEDNLATGAAIHRLVNGQYLTAIKAVVETAAELYALTKSPAHKAALDRAVKVLEEHTALAPGG